jgi:hypothetical protein
MSQRVTFSGKVKAETAGAEAKASLNRANSDKRRKTGVTELLGVDPKLGELSMARVKRG